MIDINDLELVKSMPFTWYVKQGGNRGGLYVAANIYDESGKRTTVRLHQWIMNPSKGMVVDHINHDTLDNRRENLRVVTTSQNQLNRGKGNKGNRTKIQGVSFRKDIQKYRVRVYKDRRLIYSKHFNSLEEAKRKAVKVREKVFRKDVV